MRQSRSSLASSPRKTLVPFKMDRVGHEPASSTFKRRQQKAGCRVLEENARRAQCADKEAPGTPPGLGNLYAAMPDGSARGVELCRWTNDRR